MCDEPTKPTYREAIGAAPGFLGDEKPEDVIRRGRGDDMSEKSPNAEPLKAMDPYQYPWQIHVAARTKEEFLAKCAPLPPLDEIFAENDRLKKANDFFVAAAQEGIKWTGNLAGIRQIQRLIHKGNQCMKDNG